MKIYNQRILIAVLNWGQGHVYRSVSLIQKLLSQGNTLFIACDLQQEKVFRQYFKDSVSFHFLSGYAFHFSEKRSIFWQNSGRINQLLKQHKADHLECEKLVVSQKIDVVISDHRYGFFSKNVPSIFLTHQCQLPTKNKILQMTHQRLIRKNFNEIWVLDDAQHTFAGKLSNAHGFKKTVFLGVISRFENLKNIAVKDKTVAVISGSYPYNQLLLRAVERFAEQHQQHVYCISTLPTQSSFLTNVPLDEQDEMLLRANTIISHSGYTTLLDLHFLKPDKVILIPSPHQAEQQYLADLHRDKYVVLKGYEELL